MAGKLHSWLFGPSFVCETVRVAQGWETDRQAGREHLSQTISLATWPLPNAEVLVVVEWGDVLLWGRGGEQ